MAEDKSLKFDVKVDSKPLKDLESSLKSLKGAAVDLEKAFAKSLKSVNDGFKNLSEVTKNLKESMKGIGQSASKEAEGVKKYADALKELNKALNATNRGKRAGVGSGVSSSGVGNYSYVTPGQAPFNATQLTRQQSGTTFTAGHMAGQGAGMTPNQPMYVQVVGGGAGAGGGGMLVPGGPGGAQNFIPNPPGGGGGGRAGGTGGGGKGNNIIDFDNAVRRAGFALQSVSGAANQAAGMLQNTKSSYAETKAQTLRFGAGIAQRMSMGDMSDVMALRMASDRLEGGLGGQFGGTKAIGFGQFTHGVNTVAGGVTTGNRVGMTAAGTSGIATSIDQQISGQKHAVEANAIQRGLELTKELNPYTMQALNLLQQNASGMLSGNRRLGNREGEARWLGAEGGMGMGESWQYAIGAANKFGSTSVMGALPEKGSKRAWTKSEKQIATRRISDYTNQENDRAYDEKRMVADMMTGITSDEKAKAIEAAKDKRIAEFIDAEYQGKYSSTQSFKGLGKRAMGMQAKGFDLGAMTDIMGGYQGMMGGDPKSRLDAAEKILKESVAYGVKAGMSDVQSLETVAGIVADSLTDKLTKDSDISLLAGMLTNGGKDFTPQDIARRSKGLDVATAGIQGDPWFNAQAGVLARNILGPDAPMGNVLAMQQASFKDLANGGGMLQGIDTSKTRRQLLGEAKMLTDGLSGPDEDKVRQLSTYSSFKGIDMVTGLELMKTVKNIGDISVLSDKQIEAQWNSVGMKGGSDLGAAQTAAGLQNRALDTAFDPKNREAIRKTFEDAAAIQDLVLHTDTRKLENVKRLLSDIFTMLEQGPKMTP